MSRSANKQILIAKQIKYPNAYVKAVYTEYKDWILETAQAKTHKGKWHAVFGTKSAPLHLEIGPGNGLHFARLCLNQPQEFFLAMELKYKPLIQSIRRVRKNQSTNARMLHANASLIETLFAKKELNHVYIHFPDPWLKKRKSKKHQLIQEAFCKSLYKIQKPNSFLDFKTDSLEYFEQSLTRFQKAGYKLDQCYKDYYRNKNFEIHELSQFEKIFVQKAIPINYAILKT